MTKRNTRISGALLIVFVSLILASLACYSGQIPGVFELTPFYTPTPLPVAQNARFQVLENVLAPKESGRAYFSLTMDPELLRDNMMNSKSFCQPDTAARVLFAGEGSGDTIFYLIECGGSVGWTTEDRLAGPLEFSQGELAMALAPANEQSVPLLDDQYNPQPFNPLQTCKPQTIVTVSQILAADPDNDGIKDIFYQVDCPTAAGPLKGWLTNAELFGPVELNVGNRALALTSDSAEPGGQYQLASEPAPLTEANAVEGECKQGDILSAKEARLVDNTIYFRMTCQDIEGWVDQSRFVGPLLYDVGEATVIYIEPIAVFEDQLAALLAETSPDAATPTEADTTGAETGEEGMTTDQTLDPSLRRVVDYTPPLYLTNVPGEAVPMGEGANVVGQCPTDTMATVMEYAGLDIVYYRIQCDECVTTETDEDGNTVCTAQETRDGWVPQTYLKGPLDFVIGENVQVKSSSKAVMTDEDGTKYVRLPGNLTGAASVGQYTEFTGRCSLDADIEVTNILLEKARTAANKFTFYYQVVCTGQASITQQVTGTDGVVRTEVVYDAANPTTVTGILSAKDIQAAE